MKVDSNTYIFSDPHYGHSNVVASTSTWFNSDDRTAEEVQRIREINCRNFDSLEEHNKTIVSNINERVPENATLFCLGDWSFGGIENIWEFRKQINCKNIHLILGNHDHHIERNGKGNGPTLNIPKEDEELYQKISGIHQPFIDDFESVYPQSLFSSVSHYKEISYKKHGHRFDLILFHYAMRVWNKSHRGSIMLHGHSHGTLEEMRPNIANPTWIGDEYYVRNYRTKDVGVDTNGFYPYQIDEIVDDMKTRDVGFEINHHQRISDEKIEELGLGTLDKTKYDNNEPQVRK